MSKHPYLIAIDLDGTLLTDDKRITPRTVEYLHGLSKQGHYIVIASGRPLRACIKYQEQLDVKAPIICYNGALTTHPHDEHFPRRLITLELDIVRQILSEIDFSYLDNMMIETPNDIFLFKRDDQLNIFFWNEGLDINYGDPLELLKENPMTLIFKIKKRTPQFDAFITSVVEKHEHYRLRFWDSSPYCEVYLEHGTKKDALVHLSETLHIPHEYTIAIGDAENDIQLLQWANHSIAMKNGVDVIKNAAVYITEEDNNNDGIIKAVKNIISE
ncbi:MAG: Cof-type HAD-IIB family hydrolase [Bacilli bacterium]|jgi:Cof subfamily protein (haloacid dehalogenase superfamily)